ncbi:hypothetical protein [Nocardia fusca]|uniref:Tn3 transposase DDE domain-containing protein n=1 Tax=Nocardia fusca TaxID=941183 RepID=A0ABV3FA17_9NOCA
MTVIPVATRWPKEGKPLSAKLNQLIAIEKGAKPQANADVAAAYQRVGKADLLAGISRTYRPLDDMGEELPAESKRVQVRVREVIANVKNTLTRLFDVTAFNSFERLLLLEAKYLGFERLHRLIQGFDHCVRVPAVRD